MAFYSLFTHRQPADIRWKKRLDFEALLLSVCGPARTFLCGRLLEGYGGVSFHRSANVSPRTRWLLHVLHHHCGCKKCANEKCYSPPSHSGHCCYVPNMRECRYALSCVSNVHDSGSISLRHCI